MSWVMDRVTDMVMDRIFNGILDRIKRLKSGGSGLIWFDQYL